MKKTNTPMQKQNTKQEGRILKTIAMRISVCNGFSLFTGDCLWSNNASTV